MIIAVCNTGSSVANENHTAPSSRVSARGLGDLLKFAVPKEWSCGHERAELGCQLTLPSPRTVEAGRDTPNFPLSGSWGAGVRSQGLGQKEEQPMVGKEKETETEGWWTRGSSPLTMSPRQAVTYPLGQLRGPRGPCCMSGKPRTLGSGTRVLCGCSHHVPAEHGWYVNTSWKARPSSAGSVTFPLV